MQANKKITKKGSVIIPKTLRAETGLHPGVAVEVIASETSIIIQPIVPVCRICGNADSVVEVAGMKICRNCAEEIAKKAGVIND